METNWLWDKNITDEQAKAILADTKHPNFIAYAALLLSRTSSAKEIFRDFLSRENFFVFWTKIKRQMRKDSWNDPKIDYWQAIYDTLKEEMPELKVSPSAFSASKESVLSIAREIGSKIKVLREQSGLTQKDLAKRLKISQQIISRIEGGRQNVSVETLDSICTALGVPVAVIFRSQPEKSEKIVNTFPFSSKSPEEFVGIVYKIIEGLKEEYSSPQYYDGSGDKGRDIIVYKYNVGKKEQWYFQCKRYAEISFSIFKEELDKIAKYSQEDNSFRPDGIVFVTACKITAQCKDKTKEYAKNIGLGEVFFWTDVELTAKAKAADVYDELFPITNKDLKEKTEDIKKHITSELSRAGSLTEKSVSKKDEINKTIDAAVKEIHNSDIERAKQILLNIKGKIEDNADQYKEELVRTYNNLGVCYNRFESDGGDFDEAEKYFQLAIERDPVFIKAKINLVSVYLSKGDFKKAYELVDSLWNNSDKKDPQIFQEFIWSKFHFQSSKEALEFYEKSTEAQSLVSQNEILLNLMGTMYLGAEKFEKAHELADKALTLAPNTPHNLMLKARAFMQEAQTRDVIKSVFDVIPKFKNYKNIHKAGDLLNQAREILKRNVNVRLENQIKYDLSIYMLWLKRLDEFKIIRDSIDSSKLDDIQQSQLTINDVLIEIQKRNFEIAYSKLKDSKDWPQLPYKEKARIAHILFLRGAPQQSRDIFLTIESEAEQKKDMWFYIDMSLNEVLLKNKPMAIKYAEKVKNFATDTSKEKIAFPHYNAVMMRYARDNEVDRLMAGLFEYDKKFPEDKVVWSMKTLEEDGSISEEFKSMLLKQKKWYAEIKQMFRDQPAPSYFLEKVLKRTYAEILSFRSWDELDFRIELTLPDKTFEDNLLDNFEKGENLVFDYASLLNLSKMNLLGYLEKLGRGIYISEKLFDKIQYELLQVEQEDLRNLWRFLKDSKIIHMIDDVEFPVEDKKYANLFDEWLVESLFLAKNLKATFVVDDLRLIRFSQSEEGIKCCNSFILLKSLLSKEWIDAKIYATSIGDLAERFYTFLPFSGEDLFQIVMEDQTLMDDKSKISLRAFHLVNEMFLPGSVVPSFTAVFVKFIDLLWKTGSLPEDKVKWLSFLTGKITEFVDERIGQGSKEDLEQIVPDFVQMWIMAVQKSSKDEILLLERKVDKIFEAPTYKIFKDNVLKFVQTKKTSLGIT
jgi:transcriptional regulator with XRE-family HTH domain/tetratricopeptide (TPR) repeat protein